MNVVVTGAGSGLGRLLADTIDMEWLGQDGVIRIDHAYGHDVRTPQGSQGDPKIVPCPTLGTLDVLVNCAGINRIAWFEDVDEELFDVTMDTNAKSIWRMTSNYLGALSAAKGTVLNIVSNASHMPMRGSLAYNASKGAAHIMTLQMARELYQRHGITVFGISPNKLAGTGMSDDIDRQVCSQRGWSMEEARRYQLAGLATGEETDPEVLAEFISYLLSSKRNHKHLHGCILPYGA